MLEHFFGRARRRAQLAHDDAGSDVRQFHRLEEIGELDNTLIFYILGDNGASAEGGIEGTLNQVIHMNHLTDTAERISRLMSMAGRGVS